MANKSKLAHTNTVFFYKHNLDTLYLILTMKLTGVSYFLFHKTISQQYLLSSIWNEVVDDNNSTICITLKMRMAINSV